MKKAITAATMTSMMCMWTYSMCIICDAPFSDMFSDASKKC